MKTLTTEDLIMKLSASGKTKSYKVQVETNLILPVQSKKKGLLFIDLYTPDSSLELVAISTPSRTNYKLILDGNDLGRTTKTSFNQLQKLHNQNYENSNNSRLPRIQNSPSSEKCGQQLSPLLHSAPQRVQPGSELLGGRTSLDEVMQQIQDGSDFVELLEQVDQELKIREASSCELVKGVAEVQREQLEIALEQREIAVDQQILGGRMQSIREGQQRIRKDQREIEREITRSIGSPEAVQREMRDCRDAIERLKRLKRLTSK